MIKLLIIADDFTGALDTAVQFASSGASTKVVANTAYNSNHDYEGVEVLVINAETRHLKPEEAYNIVYGIVKSAVNTGIRYIFKKTDSALRGNIGSELAAVIDAANGKNLHFVPAFPKINRITLEGTHFIEGIPVHESVFGKDPFEPVTESYVPSIIALQTNTLVKCIPIATLVEEQEIFPTIYVYDAKEESDVKEIMLELFRKDRVHLIAGCAGLAMVLPDILKLSGKKPTFNKSKESFLVICGSVNPITKEQLDYAEKNGFRRIRLKPEQKMSVDYYDTEHGKQYFENLLTHVKSNKMCIIDSNDENNSNNTKKYAKDHQMTLEDIRMRISKTLGFILKRLLEEGVDSTILITGGDTLLGFMEQVELFELTPKFELSLGTVLSELNIEDKSYQIISKSGGFGGPDLLVSLADEIII